jgi:adenylosuccinate lyase
MDRLNGLLLSEAVMFALAEHVGRQTAHDVVFECSMRAFEQELLFRQTLLENEIVRAHLSPIELDRVLEPLHYMGLAREYVDRVVSP